MSSPSQFVNYINAVRILRNNCAHENVLFDMKLSMAVGDGPLGVLDDKEKTNLSGAYKVVKYLLGCISSNRVNDMQREMKEAFDKVLYPEVKDIIFNNTGFKVDEF